MLYFWIQIKNPINFIWKWINVWYNWDRITLLKYSYFNNFLYKSYILYRMNLILKGGYIMCDDNQTMGWECEDDDEQTTNHEDDY